MPEPAPVVSRQNVIAALWPSGSPSSRTWAILDGARDERIYPAVTRSSSDHCCLFAGDLAPALRAVGPYLVHLRPDDPLTRLVLDSGWGRSWGVFLTADASLETLRRHFRKFLRVTDETGRHLLFRYYDPRVLPIYLPTCTREELATVFGPVDRFAVESENGSEMTEYRLTASGLTLARVDLRNH